MASQVQDKSLKRKHLSFRWETELCSSFLEKVDPQLWSRHRTGNWLVIEESDCSNGRADQVWGRLEPGWDCQILRSNASLLLKPTYSRILSMLRRKRQVAEEELQAYAGVSLSVLRRALRELLSAKLITTLAERMYQLARCIRFPKIEICAFEMKLDNWKRALYQSTRYRGFSHRVFVVMPTEAVVSLADKKAHFEKLGVGLMTHGTDGSTKVIVRPSKKNPRSSYQSLMALGMLLSRGSEWSI